MIIKKLINSNSKEFISLCQEHSVKTIYAFGSSTTSHFNPLRSDIDLLIDIDYTDPIEKGKNLMIIWDKLETLFDKKVDLLTYDSLKNPVFKKNIDTTKVLIYDERHHKVPV